MFQIILWFWDITDNVLYLVHLTSQRSQNEYVNNSKGYAGMVTISTLHYFYVDCFSQILLTLNILKIYEFIK